VDERCAVADVPDTLVLKRHRDLEGVRGWEQWFRRLVLGLIALVSVLGLANLFGQRPDTVTASASAATLKLYAPAHLRGGLLFMARFHVFAHEEIEDAVLVLDPGWAEDITINTIEPSPIGEASKNGRLALDLGHIPAGEEYILFIDFQVNPTNVGRRSQDVDLLDGDRQILHIDRVVTIYP
jgi:hypothetical protein